MADEPSTVELALRDLGRHLELADGDGVAEAVTARIGRGRPVPGARRLLPAAAALLAAAAVVAVLSISSARHAVADWLGLGIVDVELVEELPPELEARPDLGRPVTLAEARAAVAFDLLLPMGRAEPAEVHLGAPPGGLTLAWPDDRLVITQHPGALEAVAKTGTGQTSVEATVVDGRLAVWVTGQPHAVTYRDPTGADLERTVRLAPNTLAWDRDGVIVRIETDGPLSEARSIAESLG